ncbi:carboxylesterase [Nostoc sp. 3335mG]|nr:carboxylesterase [Nostoc sp. 3335mG]
MMEQPVATTQTGRVRGTVEGGVRRFLGIPYAAAPVGERRFRAPEPHAPWEGERDTSVPGPTPPQRLRDIPGLDIAALVGTGWVEGDDYLSLNIWAPDGDVGGLPVMVFIHGGAWVLGHKDVPGHDGTALARGGVVSVAINYRLGVEGFLPFPGCATNLGLRDQLFALAWVRDNIAAFGGDPANVTVFGESAGAMSIATLVASPLAEGLFRRAIIQSGHAGMTRSVPVMQRLVAKMAKLLGVTPDLAGFASTTPAQCLDALVTVSEPGTRIDLRDADGREPAFGLSRFVPVHGDDVVPMPPLEALKQGAGAGIEVLIGTNREEMNLYFVPTGVKAKINGLLAWLILRKVQPQARKVLKAYGGKGEKAGAVFGSALTDLVFRWPARRFAEEHRGRTHLYDFGWRSTAFGGEMGAAHGVEIPFVFDTLDSATGPEGLLGPTRPPQEIADHMRALWIGFARDGSLPWPAFDRETRQVYDPSTRTTAHEAPMAAAPFLP